jgi:hypothetical protein
VSENTGAEERAQDLNRSADAASGEPYPPAPDQHKTEPFGASPQTSAQAGPASAGESSRARGDQGEPAREVEAHDAAGAEAMVGAMAPPVTGGVPVPGDVPGGTAPSVQAAAGTSEQAEKVDGVRVTAIAPPGKPDGEVDTR